MLAYAAYSSASAYSNAFFSQAMAGGAGGHGHGHVGLPRGGSGISLDGSGPIRPIATSGSFCGGANAAAAAAIHGGDGTAAQAMRPRWNGNPASEDSTEGSATSSSVPGGSSGWTAAAAVVVAATEITCIRPARPAASRSSTRMRPSAMKQVPKRGCSRVPAKRRSR